MWFFINGDNFQIGIIFGLRNSDGIIIMSKTFLSVIEGVFEFKVVLKLKCVLESRMYLREWFSNLISIDLP